MNPELRNDIISHWERREVELGNQIWREDHPATGMVLLRLRTAVFERRKQLGPIQSKIIFTQLLPAR